MARPRLRRHNQSLPIRLLLSVYEALASLELAVLVIGAAAFVLAWATFVEGRYGADAVRFGIYGTWWFAALNLLLGMNVLAAALIRFPWKKRQTGFLITHVGILVLLVGCLFSRLGGIDAQLPVFEGDVQHDEYRQKQPFAYEDTQHFQLKIHPKSPRDDGDVSYPKSIEIPFASGPFNWDDYRGGLSWFPWRLARRDRGVIFDRRAVRLEVLDYYADSKLAAAKPIKLRVSGSKAQDSSDASSGAQPGATTVELNVRVTESPDAPDGRVALGTRKTLPGGQRVVFWVAGSTAETEAFRQSRPEGPLGDLGQLVLFARGDVFHLPVDQLQQQGRVPLGQTGLEVALDKVDREFLGVVLEVHDNGAPPERMVLLADFPEFNRQAPEHGVFGTYWLDTSARPDDETKPTDPDSPSAQAHQPRIDVMQGADRRLYYRTWAPPRVAAIDRLPSGGDSVGVFPRSNSPLVLSVVEFTPHDVPGRKVVPLPYTKKSKRVLPKEARARVRITLDGTQEEFWLEGMAADPFHLPPRGLQRREVSANGRTVEVVLRKDQIDVGFRLYLHDFQRKLDPGTSMASHYSSLVDLCDRDNREKVLAEKVLITLNEPVNFSDPATGRSYRVYQEAFRGPWKPGDPIFNELVAGDDPRDEVFLSWLTVNYDPGRGLKYLGSLLIVAGIATMFYMKAYFFKPTRQT